MININLKIYYQLIIFTLIFLLTRLDDIIYFNTINIGLDSNYKIAITEYFWEYVYLQHVNMSGKILFDKIIFIISDLIGLHYSTIFYLFNILSSYFFFYIIIMYLNNSFRDNQFLKFSLFFFIIIVSSFFGNYEIWRPYYHDHLIFALIAAFSLLIVFDKNFNKYIYLYLIFFLIMISYTLGITFFIISFFFIYIQKYTNKTSIKKDLIFLFCFIVIYFSLSFKNYDNIKIFSPSSNSGANLIQRTLHSIGNKNYYDLINKNDAIPGWFKFCNNEIYRKYSDISLNNNDLFQSKLAHGHCFKDDTGHINLLKYKEQLTHHDNLSELIKTIDKDIENKKNKIWLFSGIHDDLSYAVSAKYSSYGIEIFFNALKNHPYQMLVGEKGKKGIFLTFFQAVSYGGMFPEYYEYSVFSQRNQYVSIIYKICILFILLINLFTPYILFKKIKKTFIRKKLENLDTIYFLFLSIIIIQITIISTVTCCENPRMTVAYFPIILLITLINIKSLLKKTK